MHILSFLLQETMEGLERDEGAVRAAYMGAAPHGRQPTPPVLVKQPLYVPGQAPPTQGRPVGGLRGLSVPVSHPHSKPGHEQSEFEAPEPQVDCTGSPRSQSLSHKQCLHATHVCLASTYVRGEMGASSYLHLHPACRNAKAPRSLRRLRWSLGAAGRRSASLCSRQIRT